MLTTTISQEVDCTWGNENACANYQKINTCDFHRHCNQYSTMRLIGDASGLKILDLPSGPGGYACRLLAGGAKVVTSVDIDPKFVAVAAAATREMGMKNWHGVVADACVPAEFPDGPFDLVRANFLLENFKRLEDMYACARNLFNNIRPGGRYVGLWAPGAHTPENRRIVFETVGMDTSDITNMKSGDPCKITYSHSDQGSYEWYLRSEAELRDCLEAAGFVDVRFEKLRVDPTYSGPLDLHKFVQHVGNRNILARRPFEE